MAHTTGTNNPFRNSYQMSHSYEDQNNEPAYNAPFREPTPNEDRQYRERHHSQQQQYSDPGQNSRQGSTSTYRSNDRLSVDYYEGAINNYFSPSQGSPYQTSPSISEYPGNNNSSSGYNPYSNGSTNQGYADSTSSSQQS